MDGSSPRVSALFPGAPAALAPALEVPLPARRHGDGVGRHGLRHGGAGCDEGIARELDRGDEVRVATDAGTLAHRGAMLALPVVVHGDRAAAEGRTRADVGISDVG